LTRTRSLIAGALIATLAGGGCRFESRSADPLTTGMRLIKAGSYEAARDALLEATAIYTNSITAHCNLGVVYWTLGDDAAAIASLTKASDLTSEDARPAEILAHVLIDSGNPQGAHQVLSGVQSPSATTLTLMALAAHKAGSSDLARSYLGRALQLDENYPPALYDLALLCRDAYATPREALAYYKRFQAVAPDERRAAEPPQTFISMAVEDIEESFEPPVGPDTVEEEAKEEIVSVTPAPPPPAPRPVEDPVPALLAKAALALDKGNADEALMVLKATVSEHPNNPDAVWALMQLYDNHLGFRTRAAELHTMFCDMFPNDPRAVRKPPPPAPATTEQPLEATPGESQFHAGLAYYAAGDWDAAIAAYREALTAEPKSARCAYNLGLAHKAKGDIENAMKAFSLALQLQKDMPKALYMLGLTEMQSGRNAGALAQLNRLLRVQPDFAKAHYLLGRIYRDEGRPDMTVIHFERFIHLEPTGPSADSARRWLEQHRNEKPE